MRDFSFCIDRGGTFTDVFAAVQHKTKGLRFRSLKLLSEDPSHYKDAPIEGIRRILETELEAKFDKGQPINTDRIKSIRMGTTVATNALLERKGERMALVLTQGFRDLLFIGNQSRPDIFDLSVSCPEVLYETVVEVEEQVTLAKFADPSVYSQFEQIEGTTGQKGYITKPLDTSRLKHDLQSVYNQGIRSLAVVLKHSAVFPFHELQIGQIGSEIGFTQISLSHQVMQMVKMVPRGYTAAADAYLTPKVKKYIDGFKSGFDDLTDVQVLFMQSDGGLAGVHDFTGHKAILSGPAGGYVGYAKLTNWEDSPDSMQVIGFDMGGTSTDVSRYDGRYEHVFESVTAGVAIQAPQLDINTVAAGGGSRLFFENGLLKVGPESAGAHPGPVCYKKGGPLTITDANVVLGRIVPDFFPMIFGPNEDEGLDVAGAKAAFENLTAEVNKHSVSHGQPTKTVEEVAMGCLKIANETMCRPIRALTQMKGHDLTKHVLSSFGGAGGQHACAIARSLGIPTVFIHKYSSILSAVGMGVADVVHEEQCPFSGGLEVDLDRAMGMMGEIETKARRELDQRGFDEKVVEVERYLNLRYRGTDVAMMVLESEVGFGIAFEERYNKEFGFALDREVLIDDIRVRACGKTTIIESTPELQSASNPAFVETGRHMVYFEKIGFQSTPIYDLATLPASIEIDGPVLLIDEITTIVVEPGCKAAITADKNVKIDVTAETSTSLTEKSDPIQLAIFSHRFMSIAEQMGRTLQRTSVSVNIKERLDYSCALFGPDGGLVANAPHLPVHLGAMSEAVKFQIKYYQPGGEGEAEGLQEGDVLVSNHPKAGGSHLPDITVITPVFSSGEIVFFVASRGHHADIGGITPGSMPPMSNKIHDEGAAIISFKLVKGNPPKFQEDEIRTLLRGSRRMSDNISDLKAQVAANNMGIRLIKELIGIYSLRVVQAYMYHIRRNAEETVREMLKAFSLSEGLPEIGSVTADDQMDDGTPIHLTVTIDRSTGSAEFDFTGTGAEVIHNCNAPPAVTYSAIIYSLRCMVKRDIPLNQGCLEPITVILPESCILNPSDDAPVCGGNVLTSQRVTDVVLKAFSAAAASQGCMNNFTVGDESTVYYETIGGGAGAGPNWDGRSGVQTHMTNTRITDPEILETRYPVVLRRFHLRKGSGGYGKHRGGDGIVREVEFLKPVTVCLLSERRALPPFGLLGGGPGKKGLNLLRKPSGRVVNIGGKVAVDVEPGDVITVQTPGGGGYGHPEETDASTEGSGEDAEFQTGVPYRVGGSVIEYQRLMESA